jgi:hypothetical protein
MSQCYRVKVQIREHGLKVLIDGVEIEGVSHSCSDLEEAAEELEVLCRCVYERGQNDGRNMLQRKLRSLLGVNES